MPPTDDRDKQSADDTEQAALAELQAAQEAGLKRVEEILRAYDSFDIVAWVSLQNSLFNPNQYAEASHPGSAARIEYVALQALRRPYNRGTQLGPGDEVFGELGQVIDQVFAAVTFGSAIKSHQKEEFNDDLDMLRMMMRVTEMFMRVPGYPHHNEAILSELFSPFSQELDRAVGFDVSEAIRAGNAIRSMFRDRLRERLDWARAGFKAVEQFVRARRRGRQIERPASIANVPEALLDEWSRLSDRDLRRSVHRSAWNALVVPLGDVLTFSADDLATTAGLSRESAQAFLDAFSISFGQVGDEFRLPRAVHPLKTAPILRDGTRCFCPIPDQLSWAIKPLFEKVLKQTSKWHRYEQHRHAATLGVAARAMTRVMPNATFTTNLDYKFSDASGQSNVAELDALGLYDSILFLVEAKGGTLRPPARAGVREPFEDQVGDLIKEPHEQALRAKRVLAASPRVEFEDDRGSKVTVDMGRISDVLMVSVTLEPLGHITSRLKSDSPLLAASDDPTWTISLLDLLVIAECLEGYAPWFPHYIRRRVRTLKQGWLSSGDELDFFMYYLRKGLYFENKNEFDNADFVTLGTHTDPLDHYYFYEAGVRTKVSPRPAPKATYPFRSFIERFEASGTQGRLRAILALLDLGEESRDKWLELVSHVRKRTKRDRRLHDGSMVGSAGMLGWGLTYACADSTSEQLQATLDEYARRKRREMFVAEWIAIGELLDGQFCLARVMR